jgi:hypothetical protein
VCPTSRSSTPLAPTQPPLRQSRARQSPCSVAPTDRDCGCADGPAACCSSSRSGAEPSGAQLSVETARAWRGTIVVTNPEVFVSRSTSREHVLEVSTPCAAPSWALLECQLLEMQSRLRDLFRALLSTSAAICAASRAGPVTMVRTTPSTHRHARQAGARDTEHTPPTPPRPPEGRTHLLSDRIAPHSGSKP